MPRSRIQVRCRISPLASVLPFFRWLSAFLLVCAVVVGGYRFFTMPWQAGAYEFTSHIVGIETDAVGVLGIDTADLDDDGDIDIVTAGLDGIKIYVQMSDGTFERKSISEELDGERVQIVELTGDSALDLLVTLKSDPSVVAYKNHGDLEFNPTYIGTGSDGRAYAGDLDGDGDADIVTATKTSEKIILKRWMNNGSGTVTATTIDDDSGIAALSIGDLNRNGYQDIVIAGDEGLQLWDTTDGATWARQDIDDSVTAFTHLAVGDATGDGANDIVVSDQGADSVALYRHLENSRFERIELTGTVDATTAQIVDLDEDGDEDIVVTGQDDNGVYWFVNDGSCEFSMSTLATNLQTVFGVSVVDIDGDNDFDFVAGDHYRGTVYWYERIMARPSATTPDNVQQSTDGTGKITFETTISDGDLDPTRIRVQYSTDGDRWYKPWLVSASPDSGSVNLKNSDGYQVGTSNSIDTDANDSVKLSLTWETKSVENTGGPIVGDASSVQLRVIPRDGVGNGSAAASGEFQVDNAAPSGLGNFKIDSTGDSEVTFSWTKPTDTSDFVYKLYYGENVTDVLDRSSDVWDSEDDELMDDIETTSMTVTGLDEDTTYSFKLYAEDEFGNISGAPSIRGTTGYDGSSPTPSPDLDATPTPTPKLPIGETPVPSPSPSATPPPTIEDNEVPFADAGIDQVVNPSALVILDGTASSDPDGDILSYSWRQLSGPDAGLVSDRTANPSFSAGPERQTYIFALTVRDSYGAIAVDTVTVATKVLPESEMTPVDIGEAPPPLDIGSQEPFLIAVILKPIDIILLVIALISTALSLFERVFRALRESQSSRRDQPLFGADGDAPRGKIVHYRTGEAISDARVMVYGADKKLRKTEHTNAKGEFSSLLPAGEYTIGVQAPGFAFAPVLSKMLRPDRGVLYTGGALKITDGSKPIDVVIPMKPIGEEVSSLRSSMLHIWQIVQRIAKVASWPVFVVGAIVNTILVFWSPSGMYLGIELLYVLLVVVKVILEVRTRPAYGVVRDAITHVPLDLAVVRLFEQKTNRLIMTRVTNSQGKFFALPPSGEYMITVTKPGYAVFSKDSVVIASDHDSVLRIVADLMPVAPHRSGLAHARAAVL